MVSLAREKGLTAEMTQPLISAALSHQPSQCWHNGHKNKVATVAEMEATRKANIMEPYGLLSYCHQQMFRQQQIPMQSP